MFSDHLLECFQKRLPHVLDVDPSGSEHCQEGGGAGRCLSLVAVGEGVERSGREGNGVRATGGGGWVWVEVDWRERWALARVVLVGVEWSGRQETGSGGVGRGGG